jgi:hypothetical protein
MEAAQLLIKNVLPGNREAFNAYLTEHGFSNPEAIKMKLRQWISGTNPEKKQEREDPSIGR